MQGITGLLDLRSTISNENLQTTIQRTQDTLHHRGPDDGGEWGDPGDKTHKLAEILSAERLENIHFNLSNIARPAEIVLGP